MRILSILTAAAIGLAASVSLASAQATPPNQRSDQQQMGGSPMSGTMSGSGMSGQNGQFCLISKDGGQNCGFSTMAQCDAARKGTSTDTCTPNQTTGRAPMTR